MRGVMRLLLGCFFAGLLSLAVCVPVSFAQGPLNFGDNSFVTGDYVVAGAYGMTTHFSNGYAVGEFSIPDPNPGIHANTVVPPGAEVVAAIVYWQTVEPAGSQAGQPGTGENGYFRPLIAGGPAAPGYPITGVSLGTNNAVTWSSGGCSAPEAGKVTRTYRANVLGALPQNANGSVSPNGEFEIRLPSVGPQTPLTLGATLVIIYRILSPTVPLNSIVIYDGAFGQTNSSLNMTQTVQGFYDAATKPVSKLTLIAGAGELNKFETVYLNNVALPAHAGYGLPPFPGFYGGSWDNPTWTFGNPLYPEIANPVGADAASVTTEVVPTASKPGCLSWGAVIVSTTVDEPDNDGLLKSWKTAQGYCDVSINGGKCAPGDPGWVALPGAMLGQKDLFIQLDYMCSDMTALNTCKTGDNTNYSFQPPQNALSMITQAFTKHGINVFINPGGTIQPVHAIQEQSCSDVPGPPLSLCTFPNQAGVVGWKGGYAYFKNQLVDTGTGTVADCLNVNPLPAFCQPRFQHGRKDSWHYALFAHAVGEPEWKLQGGTLTSVVQSGNKVTFTSSTPLGTLTNGGYDAHGNILPDLGCPKYGRVSVSEAATNPNLNGTFCITSSTAPAGDTFTITVLGSSENAHYTLLTDPYLAVAPGQTGSASGVSDVGGADSLITLGLWGDPTLASSNGQQMNTIAGTFMHETGHSLGLTHGGFYYDPLLNLLPGSYIPTIEPNCKPNFQSVMNYFFQVDLLNGTVDYSEQQLDTLNEASLPAAGVTYNKTGKPLYTNTKYYTPTPPQGVGSKVTSHCDGTPPLASDPPTFLVPATANPISPAWPKQDDVDFDGLGKPADYDTLRGYSEWAPGGTALGGITTGIDLRQVSASGNVSVLSQANFFGGGQPFGGGGQPFGGGGQPFGGGGQPFGGGGQPFGGGGEINQQTADSYTRPPTNLGAAENASPRTILLTWTAPTFGQIGSYNIYRSKGAGAAYAVVATVSGTPPVTTYTDTVTCNPTGYLYFVTAVLGPNSSNPGQESVPSNVVANIPPSQSPLTGCYTLGAISLASSGVQGTIVPITWSFTDDFYTTGTVVQNLQANTLVANGPNGSVTLLSKGTVTASGSSTFGFNSNTNQFTFSWDTDLYPSGSYTFQLTLDSGQTETSSALQLGIDVTDADKPVINPVPLPAGTVGLAYSDTLTEDGGTAPFQWTFTGSLPPLISQPSPYSPTLSGTTCAAGSYNLVAMVTDSAAKPNSGLQALTLQINKANTTTTVASSTNHNPSVFQQAVTFTVTVAPQYSCTPSGTVTLSIDGSPNPLPLSGGMATYTTSALSVGVHTITASYGGDSNFNGSNSNSAPLSQTVNKANTTTAVSLVSPSPAFVGQPITVAYTLGVMAPGAGAPIAPGGTVTVAANDGSGCVAAPAAAGMCTLSPAPATAGLRTFTVTYSGDANFVGGGANSNYTVYELVFTVQPSNTIVGTTITPAIQVAAQDGSNNTLTAFTGSVTLAISSGPGTLSGTTTQGAASGVATFNDLSINMVATADTLVASLSGGVAPAISSAFNITQGWIQLSPTPDPVNGSPTTDDATQVYRPASNRMVLFGGSTDGGSNVVNDVWVLSNADGIGGTPAWTKLTPLTPSGAPSARELATAAYDQADNLMIVQGGYTTPGSCGGVVSDTWVLTNADGSGMSSPTWVPLFATGPAPVQRSALSAYDAADNLLIVNGGMNAGCGDGSDQTWVLTNANGSGGTPVWTQLAPNSAIPMTSGYEPWSAGFNPGSNTFVDFNETYVICCTNFTDQARALSNANGLDGVPAWTDVWTSAQASPSPFFRSNPAGVYDAATDSMVIFAGEDESGVFVNDAWKLDYASGQGGSPQWSQLQPAGTAPSPRIFSAGNQAAYNAQSDRMIVYGGAPDVPNTYLYDVWVLAGVLSAP